MIPWGGFVFVFVFKPCRLHFCFSRSGMEPELPVMPRQLFMSPLWSAIEPRSLAWLSALCSWSEAVSAFVLLRADLFWGASSTSWLFSLIHTAQDPISSLLSHAHIHTSPKPVLLSLQQAPPSPQATPPPATTPTTAPTTTSESFFFSVTT